MSEKQMFGVDLPVPHGGEDCLVDILAEIGCLEDSIKRLGWTADRLRMKIEYMLGTVPKHSGDEVEEEVPF